MRRIAALLAFVLAVTLVVPTSAAPAGVVEGTVTDRTTGLVAADVRVTLRTATGGVIEAVTTADGKFRFVALETDEVYQPIVAYAGVEYFLPTVGFVPGETLTTVAFDVYQTTRDPAAIRVETGSFLVGNVDQDRQVVQLLQVLSIRNDGDRAYIGAQTEGPAQPLRLRWPPGTLDVEPISAIFGDLVRSGDGFALTSPLSPGITEIVLGYDVAYSDDTKDLELDFGFPFDTAFMLVPENTLGIESRDMAFDQVVEVQGLRVARYRAGPSDRSNVALTLTGLPQASAGLSPDSTAGRAAASAVAAVGALLVGTYVLRTPRRRLPETPQAALARDALFGERIRRDREDAGQSDG